MTTSLIDTVSIHPERTGDPATLRWVVSHRTLPFAGELVAAPGLDGLLGTVLAGVVVKADALDITLAEQHDWRTEGARVRRGLVEALRHTEDWVGGEHSCALGPDEVLRMCACELIEGSVGEIATAHGGSIELVEARDGVVTVRMHGACRGCPAAVLTMHQRLETQLRRKVPTLRRVENCGA